MRVSARRRGGGKQARESRIHLAPGRPSSARQLNNPNFDVRSVWMEKVTSSLVIQEVELVKLQEEVDQLEHLVLDPPEELIKARVENEKLKYGFLKKKKHFLST